MLNCGSKYVITLSVLNCILKTSIVKKLLKYLESSRKIAAVKINSKKVKITTKRGPNPPSLATTGIRRVRIDEPSDAIPHVSLNPIFEDK